MKTACLRLLGSIITMIMLTAGIVRATAGPSQVVPPTTSASTKYDGRGVSQAVPLEMTSAPITGSQPFVTILCRFADLTDVTPHEVSWYEGLMGGNYPGMDHYWQEVSYDTVDLAGSIVVGWYNLPQPKSFYSNPAQALEDCTAVADADVYFPGFVGINLIFNDDTTFTGQAGSMFLDKDGQNKAYKLTWLGSDIDQVLMAHEMGHTFGLPHTNGIGVMNGWYGSEHPEYGRVALHTIAFHKDLPGWILTQQKYIATPGSQATITLERLAQPQTSNYLMAQVPINGPEIDFYTIEARRSAGYDAGLDAVYIYKVKRIPCADPNGFPSLIVPNPTTSQLHWLPGETFVDTENQVTVTVDSATATGYVVTIEYLPTFNQEIHLPLIVGGNSTQPVPMPKLCIISARTTDESGNIKSTFAVGDPIIYDGMVVNTTATALMGELSWSAIGPCGSIFSSSADIGVSSGTSTYPNPQNIPANACTGTYTYTYSITHDGVTSSKSTTFTVTGQ